jgi:hypothetical protein
MVFLYKDKLNGETRVFMLIQERRISKLKAQFVHIEETFRWFNVPESASLLHCLRAVFIGESK